MRRKEIRTAQALIRNKGKFEGAKVRDTGVYGKKTNQNIDLHPEMVWEKQTKADMNTVSADFRQKANERKAELDQLKSERHKNGLLKGRATRENDTKKARSREEYDIKRAFGVSVG